MKRKFIIISKKQKPFNTEITFQKLPFQKSVNFELNNKLLKIVLNNAELKEFHDVFKKSS